jgi:predicted dehydrogenase
MRNWLFYREFSGDIIVEQNCHNLDVVNWFMGKHPIKASGVGGRAMRKEGNILDNLAATFQFDDGTVFSYSASQFSTARYNDISETFICENGSINTSRKGYTVWSPSSPTPTIVKTDYDITKDAVDRFIDGVRNGAYDNAGPSAVESTLTAIMAREAIYSGKQLTFDQVANAKPGRGVPSSGAA